MPEQEGKLELIIGHPTGGDTDGQVASQSTQQYPLNVIVDTGTTNYTIVKAALRCTEGYRTTGPWEVSLIGNTVRMWGVADDGDYADEEAAAEADFQQVLTGSDTITDRNHTIWFKAMTDGTEEAMVDTSVSVRVYGRTVPTGGGSP